MSRRSLQHQDSRAEMLEGQIRDRKWAIKVRGIGRTALPQGPRKTCTPTTHAARIKRQDVWAKIRAEEKLPHRVSGR